MGVNTFSEQTQIHPRSIEIGSILQFEWPYDTYDRFFSSGILKKKVFMQVTEISFTSLW